MIATSTLLAVSAAMAVVGAGVSAYGMYSQGQAQSKMADYNAKIQNNAATAHRQQAAFEADRIRERNRMLAGTQRAAFAKSGLQISGTATDVMYDSAVEGELNALSAIYKGEVGGSQYNSQAALSKMQGDTAKEGSYFNAGGTLLGGLGQAAGYLGTMNAESRRKKGSDNPILE